MTERGIPKHTPRDDEEGKHTTTEWNFSMFDPYLSPDILRDHRRERQLYPFDPEPFKWERRQEIAPGNLDALANFRHVKARPGDPESPFIWGTYAEMITCIHGHWDTQALKTAVDAHKGRKPKKAVVRSGYESSDVATFWEPPVKVATAHTTGKLIGAMAVAGFTWQETKDTLLRHKEAGGAWWAWAQHWDGFDEERWKQDALIHRATGEVLPEHGPISALSLPSAWRGLISLTDPPGGISKGDKDPNPIPVDRGGYTYDLHSHVVRKLIGLVRTQTGFSPVDASPWVNSAGDRVATSQTLKAQFLGKIDTLLRGGYLPWLVERGVLIEHRGGIRKSGGGKGRTPDVGYRLNPDADLAKFYRDHFEIDIPSETPPAPKPLDTSPTEDHPLTDAEFADLLEHA